MYCFLCVADLINVLLDCCFLLFTSIFHAEDIKCVCWLLPFVRIPELIHLYFCLYFEFIDFGILIVLHTYLVIRCSNIWF